MPRNFIRNIAKRLIETDCKTILDLGCGHCASSQELLVMSDDFEFTGVDLNEEELESANRYYKRVFNLDMRDALKFFKEKSFDAVISLDSLEHLTKKDGLKLLDDCEKIAKKYIIIFVPKDALNLNGREEEINRSVLQLHCSEWSKKDFENKGYEVISFEEPFNHWLASKFINESSH